MNLQNAPIFAYAEKAASERHTNSAILENVNRALKMPFKLNFSPQNDFSAHFTNSYIWENVK